MNNNFDYSDYQNENFNNDLKNQKEVNKSKGKESNNRNNKSPLISIILIIIVILLVVAIIIERSKVGVVKDPEKEQNKVTQVEKEEKEEEKEEKEVSIINVNSKTRPYAIMINCHNSALPQAGLNNAYIVYELMVEGGITRMMALFKDKDVAKIGSIRSARTQYLDYVYENDAIYVHAGGAKDALNRIKDEKISDIDVDGPYGFRDTTLKRSWEHTLFTSTELLRNGIINKSIRTTTDSGNVLTYQGNQLDLTKYKNIIDASNISIKYSDYRTSNYTYDAIKKVYLRSMNNTKNVDLVTGMQYEVKNIIVYGVNYSTYTYRSSTKYQKIDNVGTGEGYYITEGKAIPIIWDKPNKNAKTKYKVKETGKSLVVNDGNTYIQIYPTSGNLVIS